MDDPVETRPNSTTPPTATESNADELKAAIAKFSKPEFREEITRLYGAAIDRAIEARDRRAENCVVGKEVSE